MDREQWRKTAAAALKGKPIEKLVRRIGDLAVHPLYSRADAAAGPEGWPGQVPYVRGLKSDRPAWDIHQVYPATTLEDLNRAILTDLARGVTSVELAIATQHGPRPAAELRDIGDLDAALAGVYDDLAPVGLSAGLYGAPAAAVLIALWQKRGRDPAGHRAALNIDPVDAWVRSGTIESAPELGLPALADVARYLRDAWPLVRSARVDTSVYHEAGATETDELAAALATGVAYLQAMLDGGLTVGEAARQISFRLAVDADLFLGIAKLRAFRQAWGRVLEAAGAEVAHGHIEASTSRAMMTVRDPWVNILRTTVGAFAAAVGGADAIHVRPLDEAIGLPDELALRLARNTQVILQDESHLAQVMDPAGGAWYVEAITAQMATAAWSTFQDLQRQGGIVATLRSGWLQDRIDEAWARREKDISRRKEPITGVSEFPHLQETPVERPAADNAARRPAAQDTLDLSWPTQQPPGEATKRAVNAATRGASIERLLAAWQATATSTHGAPPARTLELRTRAGGYESLRTASDRYLVANGHRPQLLIVALGSVAEHTARATFAKNFFEAGGIEAVGATPVHDADAIPALVQKHAGARLAVLCGTDARYEQDVAKVAPALKAAGIETIYLAGRPGEHEQAYRAAGVDTFIFMGCDVLGTLEQAYLKHFGDALNAPAGDQP